MLVKRVGIVNTLYKSEDLSGEGGKRMGMRRDSEDIFVISILFVHEAG